MLSSNKIQSKLETAMLKTLKVTTVISSTQILYTYRIRADSPIIGLIGPTLLTTKLVKGKSRPN